MKIGFDAKRIFFNRSGLGNYSRATIDILGRYLPTAELLLYAPSGGTVEYRPPANARIVYPDTVSGRLSERWWRLAGLSAQIPRDPPDIYHGLSGELPLGIRRAGCRTVLTVHDLILKRYPSYFSAIDRFVYERKGRASLAAADVVMADSEQTKRDLVEFYRADASKIVVVYLACDPSFSIPQPAETIANVKARYGLPGAYVLCVGTIEPRKNQKHILAGLVAAGLDVPVVLVGRATSYLDEVRAFARRHGSADRLIVRHDVAHADLPAVYAGASLFAYPSHFEGFGLPILEALNCGVPVITTRGGVFPETGGPGSLYVDPKNVDEIGATLKQGLTDTTLRKSMIETGRTYAQRFVPDRIAKDLIAVYESLVSSK